MGALFGSKVRSGVVRATGVRPGEAETVALSCAYFFCILAAYFIIRPIREDMAVAGGTHNIRWLFTATFAGMLAAHPIFAALVSRWPRRRFVTVCYRFFMANLALFFVLMKTLPDGAGVWLDRVFFVWISVFNLFVMSVFWSFMIDIFKEQQSKRLFGFIGAFGTVGAVAGSAVTASLAEIAAPINLLWVSVALMECGVVCVKRLDRRAGVAGGTERGRDSPDAPEPPAADPAGPPAAELGARRSAEERARRAPPRTPPGRNGAEAVIGGTAVDGIRRVATSPYLFGVCLFMLFFTVGSTFLYGVQADIMQVFSDSAQRTAVFARIDLAVNVLTLFVQLFLTGRLIRWMGVGATLAVAPILSLAGFALLGLLPVFAVFVAFQVLRRATEFALARPVREVLYTVLPRADRYKAKNFNDTFVYRTGDQIGIWSHSALGLGMAASAWAMVPVSGLWLLVALWLGRRQKRERQRTETGVWHR